MYAVPSESQYNYNYDLVTHIQNMVIVGGLGYLWLRARGAGKSALTGLA